MMYRDCLNELDKTKSENARKKLAELLRCKVYGLGFDEVYAKWLSLNIHRLNEISVRLLESLDPTSEILVKMSIVSKFDYDK